MGSLKPMYVDLRQKLKTALEWALLAASDATVPESKFDLRFEISDSNYSIIYVHLAYVV